MKIDEIHDEWDKDTKIDSTKLGDESLKIPKLHAKYSKWLSAEKRVLGQLTKKYKMHRLQYREFLLNPNKEQMEEFGWALPVGGRITKTEKTRLDEHSEAAPELIDMELMIGLQQEKIDVLKSIIQSFYSRGFLIKNAIEDRAYMEGIR
jgi:hypothetical protein